MRLLLTGVTGFIGRAVLRRLAPRHQIFAVSRGTVVPNTVPVAWDMASEPDFSIFPEGIDAIIHMAQSDQYRKGYDGASDMFQVNVASTATLLRFAQTTGVKTFCLVSTGTVYEPFCGAIEEAAALTPKSLLGATKLAGELIAAPYAEAMQLSVLRLFFPYGPGQVARLIPDLIDRVRSGSPITLSGSGDGGEIVPTFVDDLADVIGDATEQAWNGTINVASPHKISIRDIGETIGNLLKKAPAFEQKTENRALTVLPNLDRLSKLYDLSRMVSFEVGLRRTINS